MTEAWVPPAVVPTGDRRRVRGALNGSLLFEQPRHRGELEAFAAFVAAPGPVALEIGVDHGTVLIAHARERTDWRWVGIDVRRRKLARARPHAPGNALLWAVDARTLLATDAPLARFSRIDLLFPTPTTNPRHLLLTPEFVAALARALARGGVVTVATDVEGVYRWAAALFAEWRDAPAPWRGAVRSRRERVCVRDGLRVFWGHWTLATGPELTRAE